jgi:hypothetical protein
MSIGRVWILYGLAPCAFALLAAAGADASAAAGPKAGASRPAPPRRPADLADIASGTWFGDVISDARGSSRSNVRLTVTKIGPNKVRITSDYARLPSFTASLARYMNSIQNSSGAEVFLIDTSKSPPSLDVTVADASWSGVKE